MLQLKICITSKMCVLMKMISKGTKGRIQQKIELLNKMKRFTRQKLNCGKLLQCYNFVCFLVSIFSLFLFNLVHLFACIHFEKIVVFILLSTFIFLPCSRCYLITFVTHTHHRIIFMKIMYIHHNQKLKRSSVLNQSVSLFS